MEVLQEINSWVMDFNKPQIYWLSRAPGTGKTTIANAFSSKLWDAEISHVFFSCFRGDRDKLVLIFPTVAHQLANLYRDFQKKLAEVIESDPCTADVPLDNQVEKWIVSPLKQLPDQKVVIIIDALDECEDKHLISEFLSAIVKSISEIPNVKFFITAGSYVEERLTKSGCITESALDPNMVIRRFFSTKLEESARYFLYDSPSFKEQLRPWPTKEQLDKLCKHAGGQFTEAAKIVKSFHLYGECRNPIEALDWCLENLPC